MSSLYVAAENQHIPHQVVNSTLHARGRRCTEVYFSPSCVAQSPVPYIFYTHLRWPPPPSLSHMCFLCQVLEGKDVLGCAETGSGKTAAFALPILHELSKDPYG